MICPPVVRGDSFTLFIPEMRMEFWFSVIHIFYRICRDPGFFIPPLFGNLSPYTQWRIWGWGGDGCGPPLILDFLDILYLHTHPRRLNSNKSMTDVQFLQPFKGHHHHNHHHHHQHHHHLQHHHHHHHHHQHRHHHHHHHQHHQHHHHYHHHHHQQPRRRHHRDI